MICKQHAGTQQKSKNWVDTQQHKEVQRRNEAGPRPKFKEGVCNIIPKSSITKGDSSLELHVFRCGQS